MYYLVEYYELFAYAFAILLLSFIFLFLCYLIVLNNPYSEKNSGYECGYNPFSDARNPVHVKFYLISIIFIIFDVEVVFFFPWSICMEELMFFGFYTITVFLLILLVGFLYEWKKGAIDWE